MKSPLNIPLNKKSIGTAIALIAIVVLYVQFASFGGVIGGAMVGAAVGCAIAGVVGIYRILFVLN